MIEDHFAGEVAARYDELLGARGSAEAIAATVDVLADLAGPGGRALEMAVGTGRIALPLAERGVAVSGIELSPDMLTQLRSKPGGHLPVVVGDMATTKIEGTFDLVYLVFNTIGNLEQQDRQVACFENAAAHLAVGGHFVVEVGVPKLRRLTPGDDTVVFAHALGYVGFDHYDDPVLQHAVSHHLLRDGADIVELHTPYRYVWPSELDLMARLAGLEPAFRWADWHRSPFTAESASHVSAWRKPPH